MAAHPDLHLEAYDGPLDLLLDLIRRQEIDIFNIPIARITEQYLDYLHRMERLSVEIAGDFILMAATLIYIKSKMLLPPDPTAPPDEAAADPRADLVQRLLEHEQFKQAAQMLLEKQMLERASWSKPDLKTFAGEEGELAVTLWDLVKVFREVLERPQQPPALEIAREELTVAEMMEEVRRALRESEQPVPLLALCERQPTRRGLITLFLALLELIRLEAVSAVQAAPFAPILLRKQRLFDEVFAARAARQIDEHYR